MNHSNSSVLTVSPLPRLRMSEQEFNSFWGGGGSENSNGTTRLNDCSLCHLDKKGTILSNLSTPLYNETKKLQSRVLNAYMKSGEHNFMVYAGEVSKHVNDNFVDNDSCDVSIPRANPNMCYQHCFYHNRNIVNQTCGQLINNGYDIRRTQQCLNQLYQSPQPSSSQRSSQNRGRGRGGHYGSDDDGSDSESDNEDDDPTGGEGNETQQQRLQRQAQEQQDNQDQELKRIAKQKSMNARLKSLILMRRNLTTILKDCSFIK